MNTTEMESIKNEEEQFNCKLYECRNFQFPFIEILKNEKRNEYYLSFLNENYNTEKQRVYNKNIPQDVLTLFDLDYEESIKGFITEITCIQTITTY